MKNYFLEIFLLAFAIKGISANFYPCYDGSSFSYFTKLCKCENDYFYNAYEGKCQGVCDYFGDIICGENFSCIQRDDPNKFSCECQEGFIDDGSGNCVDNNQCLTGEVQCDSPAEECVNQEGYDFCACAQDYYRTVQGECQEIDYCMMPGDHPCSQVCNSEEGSFNCSCITGYVYEDDECVLDEGYEDCECGSDTSWSICSKETSTGTIYCEPKPGFQFTNETTFEVADINECEDTTSCTRGSECTNTVGSYNCYCYDNFEYDNSIGECVPNECDPGFAIIDDTCKEFCKAEAGPNCFAGTVCMVSKQNIPSCECLLNCKLYSEDANSTLSIYALSFTIPDTTYTSLEKVKATDLYDITLSMEYIFGKGYVQLTKVSKTYKGSEFKFNVGFAKPISSPDILLDIARSNCWSLNSVGTLDLCVLPSGLVVSEDSFSARNYYPCKEKETVCSSKNAMCIGYNETIPEIQMSPGRFNCVCSDGFEQSSNITDFYCVDINECNYYTCSNSYGYYCQNLPGTYRCRECCYGNVAQLQDELYDLKYEESSLEQQLWYLEIAVEEKEQQKIVVSATLGSILGASWIIVGICAFILYKIKNK